MVKFKDALNKNMLSGSILALTNIITLLISLPIYLTYLGAELYGLWVALSVIISFSQIGDLGITSAITKFVAGEYANENNKNITAYVSTATLFLAIPSLVILFTSYSLRIQIIELLGIDETYYSDSYLLVPLTGALSILTLYNSLFLGILMGLQKVSFANYTSLFSKVLQVIISIALIFLDYGIWSLFYGVLIGYLFSISISLYCLINVHGIKLIDVHSMDSKTVKKITFFGGNLVGSKLISLLMDPLNKIIISRYVGLSFVTYYEISLKGALNLRNVFEMGIRAIMPKISELEMATKNYLDEIALIYVKSLKLIVLFALPVFIICFASAEIVLELWLGQPNNSDILFGFRVFLVAYLVNLFSVPAYYILMGLNKVRFIFNAAIIRSLIHSVVVVGLILAVGTIKFEQIIYIHALSMVIAAVFILYIYKLKITN